MKLNATAREEEMRRFSDRYSDSVKSPDGRELRSNRKMHDAFRAHFRGRFAGCPDLPLQEFRSYLADFPRLGAAEEPSCEGVITECEVRNALKQVARTRWFTQRSVLEAAAHIYFSDGYVKPLVRPRSHSW